MNKHNCTRKFLPGERGQSALVIVALFPVVILALILVFDFGRFMIMRSRVRATADSAVLAAAGALDLQSGRDEYHSTYDLNPSWALQRAAFIVTQSQADTTQPWINMSLINVSVSDDTVEVTVQGWCPSIFAGFINMDSFTTSVTSRARAATGIEGEW